MLTILSHFLECQNLQLCRDKSMAVIENTNSEVMHNFIIPHERIIKMVSDANRDISFLAGPLVDNFPT